MWPPGGRRRQVPAGRGVGRQTVEAMRPGGRTGSRAHRYEVRPWAQPLTPDPVGSASDPVAPLKLREPRGLLRPPLGSEGGCAHMLRAGLIHSFLVGPGSGEAVAVEWILSAEGWGWLQLRCPCDHGVTRCATLTWVQPRTHRANSGLATAPWLDTDSWGWRPCPPWPLHHWGSPAWSLAASGCATPPARPCAVWGEWEGHGGGHQGLSHAWGRCHPGHDIPRSWGTRQGGPWAVAADLARAAVGVCRVDTGTPWAERHSRWGQHTPLPRPWQVCGRTPLLWEAGAGHYQSAKEPRTHSHRARSRPPSERVSLRLEATWGAGSAQRLTD